MFGNKIKTKGLTFDDVLLIPAYSEVLPRDVDLTSQFTKKITLKTPIMSASMDTVTEASMAIAIAREGGIGVIHKNMSIEEQARQVKVVKRAENGMIYDPISITPDKTVGDALLMMQQNRIGGIPVVDDKDILIGIITNRDLRFESHKEKKIADIMTTELVTVQQSVDLEQAAKILQEHRIEKLPVVGKNHELIGLVTYKDITQAKDKPKASKDKRGSLRVAASVGVTNDVLNRVDALVNAGVDAVVIDTAHGHSASVIKTLKDIKAAYPELDCIAGNVATAEAALALADAGADAVKIGIGPGSICTTRVIAGVGVPQLTAIYMVAEALKDKGIPVIADGGIRYSGDIAKAFVAGADVVMLGSLFAGCEEAPGETLIYNGRKFKTYRGMGSLEAMQQGAKDRYFQGEEEDMSKLVPEGIAGQVPYKGRLKEVIYQLVGGVRAAMGYCGAKNIQEMKKASFIEITSSGVTESHPHDVTITREAPNYSR